MFTTFSAQMSSAGTPSSRGSGSMTPSKIGKTRRRKVSRACDFCRLNRIKCDDEQPCRNCRNRGEKCTSSMPWEAHSLPAAKREIERLQERLKELQEKQNSSNLPAERAERTEARRLTPLDAPANLNDEFSNTLRRKSANDALFAKDAVGEQTVEEHRRFRSGNDSLYPPYAIPPFVQRMGQYLERISNQPYPASRLEPAGPHLQYGTFALPENRNGGRSEFSRAKEKHLLGLFWQGFYFLYPILDRDEVQKHHDSLWNHPSIAGSLSPTRTPSALIDIMLALSMQFSSSLLLRDELDSTRGPPNPRFVNSSLAGRWLYNRSHRLLLEEQQCPTLQSAQSSILSTIYLLNTGSLNLANTSLAISVRMAQLLGLHENSSFLGLNSKQGEIRRSIWEKLIGLDSYAAVMMALPPLISRPNLPYSIPSNSGESSASILISNKDGDNHNHTCVDFHVYHTKLVMAVQSVHTLIHSKQMELQRSSDRGGYQRIMTLESVAGCIAQKMAAIRDWVESVPQVLTIPRKGNSGKPFFFLDGATLKLEPFVPLWIQRQRLVFEITYNHLSLLVLRPFVRFEHHPSSPLMAQADSHCVVGLKHAMSLTYIVNQALSEGDALTGWHFVFRCQWDATLYILGFIFANPASPFITKAQQSIATAIHTFTILERYLYAARSALDIIHDVLNRTSKPVNPSGDTPSSWNQMLPPSRKGSSTSLAFSPSSTPEFLSGSPSSTNSEYYTITPELAAPSPQYPLWNSVLRNPFDPSSGGNAGVGPSDLSQLRNQQSNANFPSSSERHPSMALPPDTDGVLDSYDSTLFNGDWQSFLAGFHTELDGQISF
ncbi:fungal-specific transcription factor domain-containing protein [Hypoxylon crocopeplum]|nr:fungal-specific transcription factor domain-containing protein [Hypoxylon crocopeplum]